MKLAHLLAPGARVGPDWGIGTIEKGQWAIEVVRTTALVHVLHGCLAISAIDEGQADPDPSGVFTRAGLRKEPQAVADRAVSEHHGEALHVLQLVMDGLLFGGSVDDASHISRSCWMGEARRPWQKVGGRRGRA
ncbi:hypothetical protein D3C86_1165730 [compost metagenome]